MAKPATWESLTVAERQGHGQLIFYARPGKGGTSGSERIKLALEILRAKGGPLPRLKRIDRLRSVYHTLSFGGYVLPFLHKEANSEGSRALVAEALRVAIVELRKVEGPEREVSDIEDMEILLETVFARSGSGDSNAQSPPEGPGLLEAPRPSPRARRAQSNHAFNARAPSDWALRDEQNRSLGLAGEKLVVQHECQRLHAAGRADLAAQVEHVAMVRGDGAGYDVLSFNEDGSPRHIEVKTTQGTCNAEFFLTAAEIAFSEQNAAAYCLYRLYDYDPATQRAHFYVLSGSLTVQLDLLATAYRARVKTA